MIVLDFETTGLKPGYRPVEIAWIEFDDQLNEIESVDSVLDPRIPIEPEAERTHGISAEHVAGMPTLEDFISGTHWGKFAGEHVLVVAHNARFDVPMFSPFCRRITPLCTMRLSQSLYPNSPSHTLSTISSMLGVSSSPTHRAPDDARACFEVLRLIGKAHNLSIDGLLRASNDFSLDSPMPFGKHRGTKLRDLPSDYVEWLVQNLDHDNWVREVLVQD